MGARSSAPALHIVPPNDTATLTSDTDSPQPSGSLAHSHHQQVSRSGAWNNIGIHAMAATLVDAVEEAVLAEFNAVSQHGKYRGKFKLEDR